MRKPSDFVFLILLCAVLLAAQWASAPLGEASEAVPDAEQTVRGFSQDEIVERIRDVERRIKSLQGAKGDKTAVESDIRSRDTQERISKLSAIRAAYERLLTARSKENLLGQEEAHLRQRLQDQGRLGISKEPPFSLSFYDTVLDELGAADEEREALSLAVSLSRRTLDDALSKMENAQKELRRLRDQLDAAAEGTDRSAIEGELESARLETELAETLVELERTHYQNLLKQVAVTDLRGDLARRKIQEVGKHLHFDEADLKQQLDAIERKKAALEKNLQTLAQKQEEARRGWLEAQRSAEGGNGTAPQASVESLLKERRAWQQTYQAALEQTEDMLRLLTHQEQVWRWRYDIVKGETRGDEPAKRKDEIANHIERLERMLSVQQNFQTSLQSETGGLEKKLSEGGLDRTVESHLKSRIKALKELAERRFNYISALLATRQLDLRVLDETASTLGQIPLQQRISRLKDYFFRVWNFEVWVIDDRPVTVHKLAVALLILVLGILAAKYILRAVGRRLQSYSHFKETTASAIQKVLTYFSYLLVVLFALRMVNIPLAAFAFLGGAIAIGVGFGAQNLINNFISGFIMMAERPISIGDLIELEGILGKVEEIGARCTRVRTGENVHILVPNSSFLEKNITNWTLSDRKIRAKVTAGVVYGSPVREVEKLLLRAVKDNEKTLRTPEPFVIFNDFGDNALIFEVYFWITVTQVIERRLIESSIRFRIDELFREAGIVIAFPQRDVHLDAQKPIEFRLVENKE